jgi:hypothetical protein
MRPSLALPSALLLLASSPWTPLPGVHAFAEWTKCHTELEEGEIIMNHPIQKQHVNANGDYVDKALRLAVLDADGREVSAVEEAAGNGGGAGVVPYRPGQTFHLKLVSAAPTSSDGQDQDDDNDNNSNAAASPNSAPSPPQRYHPTQYLAETTPGGRFLGAGNSVQCAGRRAVGKSKNDVARIALEGGEEEEVRVWAGYASGKVAVVLTPEVVFRLDESGEARSESNPAPAPSVPTHAEL